MPHHRLTPCRLLCAGLIATACGIALAGEVRVWKDASGQTHYSDLPPPGVDAKPLDSGILPPGGSTEETGKAGKSLADQELEFRKRRAERMEQESKQADETVRKDKLARQCADARRQLAALESGQRVGKFNDRGEREILDDKQRETEAERLREALAERCK